MIDENLPSATLVNLDVSSFKCLFKGYNTVNIYQKIYNIPGFDLT